ncbi:casein kinase I isoform delta [Metarhizium rileyi]|uniref:non-specific serine/threonine protein kinase n=1 Tax=Metarhizium rileyi (strain RCEF 4871) TaxID=1649241 RepID=A0A166X7T4_METRR|nr:casein kinase I isoform delta [Metarhizium rileyi RCEF 4871]
MMLLQSEAETYTALSGGTGIPKVFWFGEECDYYVLVHELLGPSLEDLFSYCGWQFSLNTVLMIPSQAISQIEHIHPRGFLHRDIKPDNFLTGLSRQGNIQNTIDFGLAEEPREAEQATPSAGYGFVGTRRYASIPVHDESMQSWRDDLESLGYVLVYFLRGSLPWQGLEATSEKEKDLLIKETKRSLSAEALCKGLPGAFASYINHVRSLDFNERPDHAYLQGLFKARGFKYDDVFDWTEKLFSEARSRTKPGSTTSENVPKS